MGQVIAVEHGFHVFFALCLSCIVTALLVERHRLAGKPTAKLERTGRMGAAPAVAATIAGAVVVIRADRLGSAVRRATMGSVPSTLR